MNMVGIFMGISQLQGEPWHYEQRKRTCQDGSKHCLYILDNGICGCKSSLFYKTKCVGKGECEEFESKGNSCIKANPKSNVQVVYHPERHKKTKKSNINKRDTIKKEEIVMQVNNQKSTIKNHDNTDKKQENFLRLSQDRVNKILKDIELLDNLSNRNAYTYTDSQVDKMFSYIEKALTDTKKHFKEKKSSGKFEW